MWKKMTVYCNAVKFWKIVHSNVATVVLQASCVQLLYLLNLGCVAFLPFIALLLGELYLLEAELSKQGYLKLILSILIVVSFTVQFNQGHCHSSDFNLQWNLQGGTGQGHCVVLSGKTLNSLKGTSTLTKSSLQITQNNLKNQICLKF